MKRREPADVIDLTSARAGREQAEAALERVRLLCRRLLAAGDVLSLESVQMLEELGTAATLAAPEMERCLGTLDRALHEMRRLQSMIATLEGRGDPIRFGDLVEKDMIAVRIGPDIRMAVVGAPSYFADHPVPRTPRELSGQRCINYRQVRSGGLYAWDFEEKGRPFAVRVEGPLVFNNSDLIREAALAGQGLAYVYENEVVADLEAGRLTRILQKWCPVFPGYYLYHPSRRQTPPALAALIGALRYKP